jgi:hypothetical protein
MPAQDRAGFGEQELAGESQSPAMPRDVSDFLHRSAPPPNHGETQEA